MLLHCQNISIPTINCAFLLSSTLINVNMNILSLCLTYADSEDNKVHNLFYTCKFTVVFTEDTFFVTSNSIATYSTIEFEENKEIF